MSPRIFRVPTGLFSRLAGTRFSWRELAFARYPFDSCALDLPDDPAFRSDSGDFRFSRAVFTRDGTTHRLLVHGRLRDRDVALRAQVIVDDDGEPHDYHSDIIAVQEAATWWAGLVMLCHLLDEQSAAHASVLVRLVGPDGATLTSRQQVRAARRSGRLVEEIVIREGSTPRDVGRLVRIARRQALRSHPRRHLVSPHHRRYHTRSGLVTREIAEFERGGKSGEGRPYDLRLQGDK